MNRVLRHLLSVLLLPFTVTFIVPRWLLAKPGSLWTAPALILVGRITGALVFFAGLSLFAWCVSLFARVGQGTLAPWDPTRRLVAVGPYRYVRNPMISGVAAMLVGETLFFGSTALAAWSAGFVIVNHIYFLLSEEPGLERRFGADYVNYKKSVPRWWPRLRPWSGTA